jgi:ribosome recycling factor
MEDVKTILDDFKQSMEKNIRHTEVEFSRIRAGKASPEMLEGVLVEYYGNPTPLHQVANVSAPEARTLLIQPWERSVLQDIERAIINSNLGFNPQNDGETIRINIPPLTEQRRLELIKAAKQESENSKIGIRSSRKEANERLKKAQKDGLAEDLVKEGEAKVQKLTDEFIAKIEALLVVKEKEIKTI